MYQPQPWTFKLAYGFIMDRYAFLAMGRRRPWNITGQFGLIAALVAMAITNPSPNEISLIAGFAFVIGLSSATQDVAVDGLAVDILPEDEIEKVNGYLFGGQAIGMAAGGIPAMFAAMVVCGVVAAGFAFAAKVGR